MGAQQNVDVAIVGAGVTGLATAHRLTERGAGSVVLFEREGIAAGASGVQPGGVRQQWGTEINIRMAREAHQYYSRLGERLNSTADLTFRPCGYLFLAETDATLEQLRGNVVLQQRLGVPSQLLGPDEVGGVHPELMTESVVGASFCSEDGYFDNGQAVVEAFAQAAERQGAGIDYRGVRALDREGGGWRLRLEDGGTCLAEHVVVASGYDAPDLVSPLGLDLPINKEPRYLFFSHPIRERLLDPLVVALDRALACKQLADGRVLASDLSATERGDADPQAMRAHVDRNVVELLPRLEFVVFSTLVEGFYDVTPDAQPILGPVDGHPGLWLAAGFSGHGFMLAPVVSDRLATAILDDEIAPELHVLGLDRFDRQRPLHETQTF